jgi:hypothetical protein
VLIHANTATPSSWDNTTTNCLIMTINLQKFTYLIGDQKLACHATITAAVKKPLCVTLFRIP